MSTNLSQEQKERMEESRRRAMEIRAAKSSKQPPPSQPVPSSSAPKPTQKQHPTFKPAPGSVQSTSFYSGNNQSSNNYPKKTVVFGAKPSLQGFDLKNFKSGNLTLISKDRFELEMDYHEQTIVAIKAVTGREYDSSKKRWNFPLNQYDNVIAVLRKLQPTVRVVELPRLVIDTFIKRKINYEMDKVDISRIHTAMRSCLMDFQVESVKFAVSRGGRVLIADDMGLGKTIQALAISDYYRDEWPLLIVCPSSMRYQWVEEIRKHLPNVYPDEIFVINNGKDLIDDYSRVVISSYDLMSTVKDKLRAKKFGVVIMDESHFMKNHKTLRTKVGTELVQSSKRCVLLTGTPVLSRPVELYCQLQCVKPKTFRNFQEFAIRYCDAKKGRFGWEYSGSSNMTELGVLLKELLMIRRLKADVLSQLPPKRRDVVVLESSGSKLSDTSELAKALACDGLKGIEKRSTLLQYFSETGKAKRSGIMQYVKDMIDNGEKFLVFAHHGAVMDSICEAVEAKSTDYIRIDGSVKSEVRKQLCNYYQEQENCLVAVLSIKAANTGLTLTAARLVVFAELYWNPGDLIQAEDRVHRIGQVDSVLIQYLVQHGTADDLIWPLVQSKLDLLNKAGLSEDNFREADTVVIKSQEHKESKDIKDYFLKDEDDDALAGLDFSEFEKDFEIPEKKARIE